MGILMTASTVVVLVLFLVPLIPVFGEETDVVEIKEQIENINEEVQQKKEDVQKLDRKIGGYRRLISEKKLESAELTDQMMLLDSRVARAQLSIDIAKSEIGILEIEVDTLDGRIDEKELQMTRERVLLGSVSRRLYRAQFGKSTFEILMSYDSFSEFFDTMRSIAGLQSGVHKTLTKLTGIKEQLKEEREQRESKRQSLVERRRELEIAKNDIEDERGLKNAILMETQSSELQYRYLLAELKREQNEADSEIAYLERVLREKLKTSDRLKQGDTILSWSVEPVRGLSTLFHDPDYPFRNIFEHPAIDIRAYQGTPVRAAASGIVARAKDGGMGYSYVMLLHNNNISTIYGHVSKIVAKEDTFVERGEIIAYSGGMPGTPGAGRLTTGPHLHFETRLRGIPVDPLNYLVRY